MRPKRRSTNRYAGLTFVELMLAIGVTAVIGAAISSMLVAASYGTDSSRDIRASVVQHTAINSRLSSAVRASRMVLEAGSDYMVLWTSDTRRDGVPSLSEIRLIERDSSNDELRSYKAMFAADLSEDELTDLDVTYTLDDNYRQITNNLKNSSGDMKFPGELWASHVNSWEITLDATSAQDAKLVSFRLQVQVGDIVDDVIAAAALRNKYGIAGGTGDTTTSALLTKAE